MTHFDQNICIKCNKTMSYEEGMNENNGWEKIVPREDHPEIIWLCPKCIDNFCKRKPKKDIKEIYEQYQIALQHDHDNTIDLKKVIGDILNYLSQ